MTTAAQKKKVHKVMHEHKKGRAQKRLREKGAQPQAGCRNRDVRIPPIKEKGELITTAANRAS